MIFKGNILSDIEKSPEKRGWIAWPFFQKNSPTYSEKMSIKWANHKNGDTRIWSNSEESQKSIDIVLEGRCIFQFPTHDIEYILEAWEYITYDTSECTHTFEALSDCTLIIIREAVS